MMVLSGFLRANSETRPRSASKSKDCLQSSENVRSLSPEQAAARQSPQHIYNLSQIPPDTSEEPDLRDLNNSLVAVAAIFPDVQVEVFREMLSSFHEESRLAVITEALLKNKLTWVRGRYRVAGKEEAQTAATKARDANARGTVAIEDKFRSVEYKNAVKTISYHEFKGLSHSTIKAVLAEHNHSYTLARPTLVALNARSWRFSITSIFRPKRPAAHEAEHPLVVWHSTGHGSIVPSLKTTGSIELDRELFESLVVPLQAAATTVREAKDRDLAVKLNNKEAEDCDALYDCECCFTSYAFEELTACDEGGHFLCSRCVQRGVSEAVFGQGWARNIDHSTGALRCMAPMSDDCTGCIPRAMLDRAFVGEKGCKDVLDKLDEKLADENLLKTQLPLIRCPFCSYAEVDELYLPSSQHSWRFRHNPFFSFYTISIFVLGAGMIPFLLPVFVIISLFFLLACSKQTFGDVISTAFANSVVRLQRRRHGLRFTCQHLKCGRSSCISCGKAWSDIHICHESSVLALRTQVELAMSLAIKRTCPRCNTSFVKSSGCNKLTCICGYQMCYVCRKDIGSGEGYRHFCEHFRPTGGGGCSVCDKCDLYRCEDDEVVVKKAKEEAEARWLEKEGGSMEGAEAKKVLSGSRGDGIWAENGVGWCKPDWEKVLDAVVEKMIE